MALLQSVAKTFHLLFLGPLEKKLQCVTNRRMFHEFQNNYCKVWQKIIARCDNYYKVRQDLLQSVTGITGCDSY